MPKITTMDDLRAKIKERQEIQAQSLKELEQAERNTIKADFAKKRQRAENIRRKMRASMRILITLALTITILIALLWITSYYSIKSKMTQITELKEELQTLEAKEKSLAKYKQIISVHNDGIILKKKPSELIKTEQGWGVIF